MPDAPILAYASPSAGVDPSEIVCAVQFDPPPIGLGLLHQVLWLALCACGIGVSVFVTQLMIAPGFSPPALIVPALAFIAVAAFCLVRAQIIRRLWRFGRMPVRIIVTHDNLILIDPPRWGSAARVHPMAAVLAIGTEFAGWWFGASWLYRINIAIHQGDTAELCVSVEDMEAFSRNIANLQSHLHPSAASNEVSPSHA